MITDQRWPPKVPFMQTLDLEFFQVFLRVTNYSSKYGSKLME